MFWLINLSVRMQILASVFPYLHFLAVVQPPSQTAHALKVLHLKHLQVTFLDALVDFMMPPFQMTNFANIIPHFCHPWSFNPGVCNHLFILGTVSNCIGRSGQVKSGQSV